MARQDAARLGQHEEPRGIDVEMTGGWIEGPPATADGDDEGDHGKAAHSQQEEENEKTT
jgi:hypothetical protein